MSKVLSKWPELALSTLGFLPWQHLSDCAPVCKLWAKTTRYLLDQPRKVACASRSTKQDPELYTFVASLPFRPAFAFLLWSGRKVAPNVPEIRQHLPYDCPLVAGETDGTICCKTHSASLEVHEVESGSCCTLTVFPAMPGVAYTPWRLTKGHAEGLEGDFNRPLRALVFLCTEHRFIPSVLQLVQQYHGGGIHVAGGVTGAKLWFNGVKESKGAVGFGICGDVQCESAVATRMDIDVLKVMPPLKAAVETPTYGMLFPCVARGMSLHEDPNVESKAFLSMFPHTPLTGFFCQGEIHYITSDDSPDAEDLEEGMHAYSSVFLVWGPSPQPREYRHGPLPPSGYRLEGGRVVVPRALKAQTM